MYSVDELGKIINAEIELRLSKLKQKKPAELYQPIEYALNIGGKRLRPVMLLMSYNLFSEDLSHALPAAYAIEIFHNFTLLHDDIMDKAEMRRNSPTVHQKYSENNAILSGDAMAFISYEYLFESKSEKLNDVARLFTETAIEVCEGQQYDMDFENRLDVSEDEYLEMIRLKTAVLLGCSLKAGALLANQSDEMAKQLYHFGLNLGLAFQLQDDLLDTFGNPLTFGKKIGGDILANKKTYLLIKALSMSSAQDKNELLKWISSDNFVAEEKIIAVTNIYNKIGIKQLTEEKINFYFEQSSKILQDIALKDVQKHQLETLSKRILKRDH